MCVWVRGRSFTKSSGGLYWLVNKAMSTSCMPSLCQTAAMREAAMLSQTYKPYSPVGAKWSRRIIHLLERKEQVLSEFLKKYLRRCHWSWDMKRTILPVTKSLDEGFRQREQHVQKQWVLKLQFRKASEQQFDSEWWARSCFSRSILLKIYINCAY